MFPCVGTKKAMGINKPTAPKIVEAVGRSWVCPWPQSKYDYFRRRRADPVLKPKKQKPEKRAWSLTSIKSFSSSVVRVDS